LTEKTTIHRYDFEKLRTFNNESKVKGVAPSFNR